MQQKSSTDQLRVEPIEEFGVQVSVQISWQHVGKVGKGQRYEAWISGGHDGEDIMESVNAAS